ncbi:MAG: ABC transporter substrate-binding protein [Candidatus Dormibacteria bacterium]
MKRTLAYATGGVLLSATLLAACGSTPTPAPTTGKVTINVGVPLSLTGPGGVAGVSMQKAITLGFTQANHQLAALGIQLKPFVVNDQTDGPTGVTLVQQLIAQDSVGVIAGFTASNVCAAALPVAQAAGVPTIQEDCVAPGLDNIGRYIFSTTPSYAPLVAKTINFIAKPLHLHTAAILENLSNPAFAAELGAAEAAFKANGVTVTSVQTEASGAQTNFTAQLSQIAGTHPDAVVLFVLGSQLPSAMTEARQLGLTNAIFIGEFSANTASVPQVAGQAAVNTYFPAHWASNLPSTLNKSYVASFKAAYGALPDGFASNGYIGIEALVAALKTVKRSDLATVAGQRKAIEAALLTLKSFACIAGTGTCDMATDRQLYVATVPVMRYVSTNGVVGLHIVGYISGK